MFGFTNMFIKPTFLDLYINEAFYLKGEPNIPPVGNKWVLQPSEYIVTADDNFVWDENIPSTNWDDTLKWNENI